MTTTVRHKTTLKTLKCPYCGGPLVRSKSWSTSGHFISWLKPWASWMKLSVPVWPWACMNCGRMTFYLKDSRAVLREFRESLRAGTIEVVGVGHADEGGEEEHDSRGEGGFQRIR